MTALPQVTFLYCNIRTVLLLATVILLSSYRLGVYIEQRHSKRHSKRYSKRHSKPGLVTALLQVTFLYCNIRTVLLLATVILLSYYRLGGVYRTEAQQEAQQEAHQEAQQAWPCHCPPTPAQHAVPPSQTALRYRYVLCKVGPWCYWT